MMLKYCLLAICTLTYFQEVFGQGRIAQELPASTYGKLITTTARSATEEVLYPIAGDECTTDNPITIGIENAWGRVSGMNSFGDLEKAQRLEFDATAMYKVVGALVYFERAAIVGNGQINVKVYKVDPANGGPGRLIGFSDGLRVTELLPPTEDSPVPTMFTFESGVEVNLDEPRFFVSCDFSSLYATRDTVVVLQTRPECGDGGNTWELFNDGITWLPISTSWEINSDWLMGAIVEFDDATSADDFISRGGIQLHPPAPNPVIDMITLPISLERARTVYLEVYDASGKVMYTQQFGLLAAGHQNLEVQTIGWPQGYYYYRVSASSDFITSRFIVGGQ